MIKISLNLFLVLFFFISPIATQTCSETDEEFYVTFHPHLDAFWLDYDHDLKNINWRPQGFLYQMNQRNSKTILNSMYEALVGSPQRKYFITEAVFFKDWYDYISPQKKLKVKQLLQKGQLEIANGGWVENDEAVCYYDDILDQYTLGMNFLANQLDYQVKTGWATDSFGHSHSQVALEHTLGIQFQGIQRVDDRYVNLHKDKPLLQFYWSAISDSNNLTYGGVLNHIRHFLHEVNNLRGVGVESIKRDFGRLEERMKEVYQKNKLFRFLGNDFQQFITEEFVNLESAMKVMNNEKKQQCPKFKYGNPLDYLKSISKHYESANLPVRQHDFIANWDQDRYWSGYFTTDPQLKKDCKDFSRLVNFYRKSLLFLKKYPQNQKKLIDAEQILAVLQHHDGITATSKTYIEDEFKRRMANRSETIFGSLNEIYGIKNKAVCKFYKNENECDLRNLPSSNSLKQLQIVVHGGSKKQKVELKLPSGVFYDIQQSDEDIFCDKSESSVIVFEADLHPGTNQFNLVPITKEEMSRSIFYFDAPHSSQQFQIQLNEKKNGLKYKFGNGEYFDIGIYFSPNNPSSRQSVAWDKYGKRMDKVEHVIAGMYIMSNSGKINPINDQFTIAVAEGKYYKRAILTSKSTVLRLTIKNDSPNIVDLVQTFKPQSRTTNDYFLKVGSSVKSDNLYHDANGFLVAKREINKRPDYEFIEKPEDRINANNYPVCSFAYFLDGDKKMTFFTDRALGVSSFDKDMLINFDRLAQDDGKGVGEPYMKTNENTWRFKFALVSAKNNMERQWQKQYDQAMIGFISTEKTTPIPYKEGVGLSAPVSLKSSLKYTIFWLNQKQFVLRLQNLAEFSNLQIPKFTGQEGSFKWSLPEIGFEIDFKDIKQSYSNGIVKETGPFWRVHWSSDKNEINLLSQDKHSGQNITLRPLEIISFRVNLEQKIVFKNHPSNLANQLALQKRNSDIVQSLDNVVALTNLRKRCF